MLLVQNSFSAASLLVGSVILVSATGLSALDASITYYRSQSSPHGINGINGLNGLNGINGINGLNGLNGINGINGLNGINGINGVNGLNGINASEKWSDGGGMDLGTEPERKQDTVVDGDESSTRPFGGATMGGGAGDDGGGGDIIRTEELRMPPSYPDAWKNPPPAGFPSLNAPFNSPPLNAPFNTPPMNAEWNAPVNAINAGSRVYPVYPPTWKYPPLVEKVSVGLSSVGVEESEVIVPRGAAPEPLPSPPPSPPVSTGVIDTVVGFFKSLWPF